MVAPPRRGPGTPPRYAIGSVGLAECFVTVTISVTVLGTIGLELWPIIAGLIRGGVLAAPFAAYAARAIPDRPLMIMVGCVVIRPSLRGLIQALSCRGCRPCGRDTHQRSRRAIPGEGRASGVWCRASPTWRGRRRLPGEAGSGEGVSAP